MTDTQTSFENISLIKVETQRLERDLFFLDETLKAFPNIPPSDQGSVGQWARFEEWARLARNAVYRIFDQLGPDQAHGAESRAAFLCASDALDQVTDIVERKYQQLSHEDFEAARVAVESCLHRSRQLLRAE